MGTSSSTENAIQCSINKTVKQVTEEHELELDENVVENSKIEHDEDQIEISVHEIDDYSNDIEIEEAQDNIEEDDPIDCAVCNSTTQHVCSLCGKNVCQIFCSEQDPISTNEYHQKHKDNDPRCSTMLSTMQLRYKRQFKLRKSHDKHPP